MTQSYKVVHHILAVLRALFRATPLFRGKYRVVNVVWRLVSLVFGDVGTTAPVVMWDGTRMRLDVWSRTENPAFWSGEYERKTLERLASCLKPGSVVLDVGANIGFYSIALGSRLKPLQGTLYAFEPVSSNYHRLKENIVDNELESVVRPVKAALGYDNKLVYLASADDSADPNVNAVIEEEPAVGRKIVERVQMLTLDRFAAEGGLHSCTLIKADIEGAEVRMLQGARVSLARYRPIVYGEFNSLLIRKFGDSFLDAVELLRPLGYRFYIEAHGSRRLGSHGHSGLFLPISSPSVGMEHVLMVPQESTVETLAALGVCEG